MATVTESLDTLESKIQELELKVYGEKPEPTENFNPTIDSLPQLNNLATAALRTLEKFISLAKRVEELINKLELNLLSEDPTGVTTKLNIILPMKDEYEQSVKKDGEDQ